MKERTAGFPVWIGILAAASGMLAPRAFADPWCPNSRDYNITCVNCSRELTCDVYNTTIWINGSGVTLDGQGHTIYNSPDAGIKVYRPSVTIQNVNISNAGRYTSTTEGHGIYFVGAGVGGAWSTVDNVYVSGSKGDGLYNASGSSVRVQNSEFNGNLGHGIVAAGGDGIYTDVYTSGVQFSGIHGYVTSTPASYVINDTFYSNGSYGAYAANLSGLLFNGDTFISNYRGLTLVNNTAPTVIYNTGYSDYLNDCFDYGSTEGTHYSNSWVKASGTNCTP